MSVFDNGPVLLDGPDTMLAILKELAGDDALTWRGAIDVWGEENPPSPARWRLKLNDNEGHTIEAFQGSHLAYAYGQVLHLTNYEG